MEGSFWFWFFWMTVLVCVAAGAEARWRNWRWRKKREAEEFTKAAPAAMKLDGTAEDTLARSLLALPPDKRGWITFAEARIMFSTKGDQHAFERETDKDGRRNIMVFATNYGCFIKFMPVEGRVYFVRRRKK